MKRVLLALRLALVGSLVCLTSAPHLQADVQPWPFGATRLTDDDSGRDDRYPEIHDGQIVWEGGSRIFYWDGTTTTEISTAAFAHHQPDIWDGQVAWRGSDGSDYEVWLWDGTNTTNISNNTWDDGSPDIRNGEVVWSCVGTIEYWDGNSATYLTNSPFNNTSARVCDGEVIWHGFDLFENDDFEIFYWNGGAVRQITDNGALEDDAAPQIDGGEMTWYGYEYGSPGEIFYWDGTWSGLDPNVVQLTDNTVWESSPHIHNGQIAWVGENNIYFWDGTWSGSDPNITQVTDDSSSCYDPQINNGHITWWGSDGNDNEIFYWDGTTAYQVTNNDWNDLYPRIWDGQITWESEVDGADWEIMEAHMPEPATLAMFTLGLAGLAAKLRRRKN